MSKRQEFDYAFRVAVFGDRNVGKSSVIATQTGKPVAEGGLNVSTHIYHVGNLIYEVTFVEAPGPSRARCGRVV
jgi:GTP-binding protein EngB required for normal cell division